MGQHQIIDKKLKPEFEVEITSERQVVYILVEIGKLIEHDNAKEKYPTIMFYRNWVVHTKLDHSAVADRLVRLFDGYITSNNKTASETLKQLVSPQTLRAELKKFLKQHGLRFSCCEDGVLWKRFVKYLAGIIDETPLQCSWSKTFKKANHVETVPVSRHGNLDGSAMLTNHVQRVTVSRRRNLDGNAMLTWSAHCHTAPPSGVETEIEVVLLPDIDHVDLP
jgi:hypothetical protein